MEMESLRKRKCDVESSDAERCDAKEECDAEECDVEGGITRRAMLCGREDQETASTQTR
jgi:hypothetical protein